MSLQADEVTLLRKTRRPELALAREMAGRLGQEPVSVDRSRSPLAVRPGFSPPADEPAVCLTLVPRAAQSPACRWPPQPAHMFRVQGNAQILKWTTIAIIVCVMYPPAAKIPGFILGYFVRSLAYRLRECGNLFLS